MGLEDIFVRCDAEFGTIIADFQAARTAVAGQPARISRLIAKDALGYEDVRAERETLRIEASFHAGLPARLDSAVLILEEAREFYEHPKASAPVALEGRKGLKGLFRKQVPVLAADESPGPSPVEVQSAFVGRSDRREKAASLRVLAIRAVEERRAELEDMVFLLQEAAVAVSRSMAEEEGDAASDALRRRLYHLEELTSMLAVHLDALVLNARSLERKDFGSGNGQEGLPENASLGSFMPGVPSALLGNGHS